MKIFALSDLHLAPNEEKSMDIFGERWKGHFEKIKKDWNEKVSGEDAVLVPGDYNQTRQAVRYAAKHNGPVYIRLSRMNVPEIFDENYELDINKAVTLKEGKDVSVFVTGDLLAEVTKANEILQSKGIDAEIINIPVIKPLDTKTIVESVNKTGLAVTVENHSILGGLGSAVCETLSENAPHKVLRIGINDTFGQSGTPNELLKHYGLDAESIANKIIELKK